MLENLNPEHIQDLEGARQALKLLLNLVEELKQENHALRAEVQRLRDEINRLKGEQGKPDIKPHKKASSNYSAEKERRQRKKRRKGSKLDKISIDREETLSVDQQELPQDVWVYTPTLRSSETAALGLRVHHQGGKQPVTTTVRFYEGNPEAGGALIGEAETPLIATRDSENTGAVSWTPDTEGSYDIYAVIDPDDLVKELPPASAENNNVLYRTFTVLPPSPDGAPPRMDNFTINDGADRTSVPDVQLDAEASEMDIPNQSGVSTIRYEEFVYNEGAEDWVLVQHSNWLDYDGFHTDYPWSMLDSPGVHYIRAWVADGASNISATPAMDFINHVPVDSTEHVAANGTNLYRRYLEAGDRLTVCVTPVNGDPDLYVWPPDWRDGAWSSVNNNLTEDLVSFEAPDSGVYQIEVYGYTAADYRLEITIDSTQTTATTSIQSVTNETATNSKTLRGAPVVDPQDTPSNQLSVPEPPTTLGGLEEIYLPLVIRN